MKKNLKIVKSTILTGIVLFSVFAALVPTAPAGPIAGLASFIEVNWDSSDKPIVPRGEMRSLDLDIVYGVTKGAFVANAVFPFYLGRQVTIQLQVVEASPWCTASLPFGTLTTVIQNRPDNLSGKLNIRLDEDAPAYGGGFIKIKASVEKIGPIDGFDKEFTLEFQPAYLPLIKAELPETNSKRIGPMDTASFPIEIENLGNARTKVYFQVEDVPDGWIAVVTDDIILDETAGSKGTAYLTIRPPKGFGYHDEDVSVRVSMVPARAENTQDRGNPEYVTVIVESRGFSVIGAEVIIPIVVLILVVLFVVYFLFKRYNK